MQHLLTFIPVLFWLSDSVTVFKRTKEGVWEDGGRAGELSFNSRPSQAFGSYSGST